MKDRTLEQRLEVLPPHLSVGPPAERKDEQGAQYQIEVVKHWAHNWRDWQDRELGALKVAIEDKNWVEVSSIHQRLEEVTNARFPDLDVAIDHLAQLRP